jgi:hypothetical protein
MGEENSSPSSTPENPNTSAAPKAAEPTRVSPLSSPPQNNALPRLKNQNSVLSS